MIEVSQKRKTYLKNIRKQFTEQRNTKQKENKHLKCSFTSLTNRFHLCPFANQTISNTGMT